MVCDVISAVTEFMVRVLLLSRAVGIRDGAEVPLLNPSLAACDVISVVTEFMVVRFADTVHIKFVYTVICL
jgi:hypothetical protein